MPSSDEQREHRENEMSLLAFLFSEGVKRNNETSTEEDEMDYGRRKDLV